MKSFKHPAMLAVTVILMAGAMLAQSVTPTSTPTPAQPGLTFTTSTQALAVSLGGQTSAATDISPSLGFLRGDYGAISLAEHNILAPGINLEGYYGGMEYVPNLASAFAKTLLPPNTLQPYFEVAVGDVLNTSVGKSHFSAFVGGGIKYDPTGSGKFLVTPIRIDYFNAPGFGHPNGVTYASGLAVVFGK